MGRVLALDYGRRRIGVAISDELGFGAKGLSTLKVSNKTQALDRVVDVLDQEKPSKIVVGLPLNLDGSKGDMAQLVETFVTELKQVTDVPVLTLDERLTSVAAHRTMQEMGIKQKGNKGQVDKLAAVYLLEIYLQQVGAGGWATGDTV